ncbi:MAG: hypothetical protein U9N87_14785 [Planctomycetota bacterium]|nr:hypothetical protein [Planctomycetota bacterium]
MHILTGMLIAGIIRHKRKASLLPMLRKGPVQTAHLLPGRVRFRIPSLVDEASRAEDLCSRLETLDGVEAVQVTPSSGSVLVSYQEELVRPELLFAAIVRLLGLEKELERTPRPAVTRELRSVFDSLNRVVYDRTGGLLDFSSAVLILMAAFGVSRIIKEGSASIPPGFALLWWGAHQLFGQQGE